ncbi:MAG: GIY-YIG nuclease family protein [Desulfobacterales bacterium]|nr:GIY-YIG nuclease family protein [Desulfobacterales bacterium]
MKNDYYVYMYIDPRNNEEFYYGKGRGKRKFIHLKGTADSDKTQRIAEIRKAGSDPIIKVIAAGLTEDEAHLIETTLLWKLGRFTDNIASGNMSKKFRRKDTLHIDMPGFDFNNEIYRANVGEQKLKSKIGRKWEDCIKYGFLCAGGGNKWIDLIKSLNVGDILVVYLTGKGFVGIGRVKAKAVPAIDFKVKEKPILNINTLGKYDGNKNNLNNCQYMAKIKWIKTLDRDAAVKASGKGFNLRGALVSISKNSKMIQFINRELGTDLNKLAKK